jgi:LysR family glycine cleavage system transcriptional activator
VLALGRRWRDVTWLAAAGAADAAGPRPLLFESRAHAFDAALSGAATCLADPRMTAADEAAGSLVRLHPLRVSRPQGIHLVYPGGAPPDPRLSALADWMRAEAAALG